MVYREDKEIVELFVLRDEEALREVQKKYNSYMRTNIRYRVHNEQDMEECLQDVYFALWNTVHIYKPKRLKRYIFALCKRKSYDRVRYNTAKKRNCITSELFDVPDGKDAFECIEFKCTLKYLAKFLEKQECEYREIFVMKYFEGRSLKYISKEYGRTESSVKMILYRMKQKLMEDLGKNDCF